MSALVLRVQHYIAQGASDNVFRPMRLEVLAVDLAESEARRVTIERDESSIQADHRTIRAALDVHDCAGALRYEHAAPADNTMLWISNAVAWCYQAGGDSMDRFEPLVSWQ